jgi:signal transduction histidine kinase
MTKYDSPRSIVIGYALTAVFCFAIAWLLWTIDATPDFKQGLSISLSIGMSCISAFVFIEPLLQRHLPVYLSAILTSAIGLAVGLIIAGILVTDNPWYFLSVEQATLALGVFFSVLGYLVMGSRDRVFQLRTELAKTQANQAAAAQKMAETELRLLQAQIEPHFLFNTLSNVTSMIHTNPEAAEQTLNNLSTLLRNSLRQTREPLTTLGEELRVLRAYLDIQKIRMGDRLQYHIDAPADLSSMPIPPLLLQPLVENAIRHGIEPAIEGGRVDILVEQTMAVVQLSGRVTGFGIVSDKPSNGTGLRNVRERLQALYQNQASLKLTENTPQGVLVELQLPLEGVDSPAISPATLSTLPTLSTKYGAKT